MSSSEFAADVIVVGAGNAAACAALSAHENGASVVMLEASPQELRGGNSTFTGGMLRFAYNGAGDLKRLVPDMVEQDLSNVEFDTYTEAQFFDDMGRLTQYRCDPDLTEVMIKRSFETTDWMRTKGVRLELTLGSHAFKVGGKFKFWGGLPCQIWGGGPGLIDALHTSVGKAGIRVLYETPAIGLLHGDQGVIGVRARREGRTLELRANAVVLACGGFESNAEMRARYLGPNWDLAHVRGTRFNTGRGIQMALDVGAMPTGHWSGCHATEWDMNAPPFGDLAVGDSFQKHNYTFCVYINAKGERFVDEGADFHTYTYAKYGREVLAQPGLFAWQIFDQKVTHLLREDYRIKRITKVEANTFEELAPKLEGVDGRRFLETIKAFNEAPRPDVAFDPNSLDGLCTRGLAINKSNWAQRLDKPPYHAYGVTCGVTFTFGGLKITTRSEVEDTAGKPIPGLYAAGELVGGIYYHNYASGSGLMSGAVFGRIGGRGAAAYAATRR
ncbi:MAG: FAD-dependent tricarballylate dehydrogenase TcuA [Betaproteobacteria bacterium]|nr:FAD-dependent tricarballylate dehydrogenase TcuA [Betaproteobacteria bacterium]